MRVVRGSAQWRVRFSLSEQTIGSESPIHVGDSGSVGIKLCVCGYETACVGIKACVGMKTWSKFSA